MKKYVLFDFDGTIADTLPTAIKIVNKLSKKYGYKKIYERNIEELRSKKTRQIMRMLKVKRWKLPKIAFHLKAELNKNIKHIRPVKGIKTALRKLKKNGYLLGIITTNSKENVTEFLQKNKLELFDFIYYDVGIFSKRRVFRKFTKKNRGRVVYVGDETRDIVSANKAKIGAIGVSWGLNSKEILMKQKPKAVAEKPKDLVDIIKKASGV